MTENDDSSVIMNIIPGRAGAHLAPAISKYLNRRANEEDINTLLTYYSEDDFRILLEKVKEDKWSDFEIKRTLTHPNLLGNPSRYVAPVKRMLREAESKNWSMDVRQNLLSHNYEPIVRLQRGCSYSFPDTEPGVHIPKTVRGKSSIVIQPTCLVYGLDLSASDSLMDLLTILDALKRASADPVIAVLPYFGFGRQDRKEKGRVPITAKLVAETIEEAGADRVLIIELHAGQIQGFFDIPVDNLLSGSLFYKEIYDGLSCDYSDLVILGGDDKAREIGRKIAEGIEMLENVDRGIIPVGYVDKDRIGLYGDKISANFIVGIEDTKGKTCLVVDDMIATGGTSIGAFELMGELPRGERFREINVFVPHGICCDEDKWHTLQRMEKIKKIFISDTVKPHCIVEPEKVKILGCAERIARVLWRIFTEKSVSKVFRHS